MQKNIDKEIYDVLIIGGGAGGLFASTTANFFNLKNVIIEQKSYLGGQPVELYPNKYIYDFPCFQKIKSNEVIKKLIEQQQAGKFNEIRLNTIITDVEQQKINDEDGFFIQTNNGNLYAKNIIIATGYGSFNPRKLEINGKEINHDDIHYSVNVVSDIYKDKKIVILGGGDSAVDWANFFIDENISKYVTIIHRRNQYRCSSNMVEELTKNNVLQKLNYEISNIDLDCKKLEIKHNENQNIESIPYDYLIVQYGQVVNRTSIKLFDQINKEKNKIVADISQKTNIPYIYAIGDAIYYKYKANTIVTTCGEATRAIWNIAKNKMREW